MTYVYSQRTLADKLRSFFPLLLLLLALHGKTFGSELLYIRTEVQNSHVQFIFQFDSDVQYEITEGAQKNSLILRIEPVSSSAAIEGLIREPRSPLVNDITYAHQGQALTVTMLLKNRNTPFSHYSMKWPFKTASYFASKISRNCRRILLLNVKKPETTLSMNATAMKIEKRKQPPDVAKKELPPEPPSEGKETPTKSQELSEIPQLSYLADNLPIRKDAFKFKNSVDPIPKSPKSSHLPLLIYLIGGFIILDIGALGLYLNRKNKRPKDSSAPPTAEPLEVPPETESVGPPEFIDILQDTLSNSPPESAGQNGSAKQEPPDWPTPTIQDRFVAHIPANEMVESRGEDRISSMIESLEGAVERSTVRIEPPPDLNSVVHDLELIASSSQISKELTREQLIGQDGSEFLRNVKRLLLN